MSTTAASGVSEKTIALDLLNSAKQAVMLYARAINEAQNQQLRNVLEKQMMDAVHYQQSLAQFAIQQGYYQAKMEPMQMVKQNLQEASQAMGYQMV
ncbi:spore coat protein [Brevibacillus fulvus]|uniref:Spore coat protein CotF n=1 Tax=Brevibacillus fulvus TaxID=1125967 RepID=A0A938XUW7_9BACL|nr:spore coat protein [Brevibacillus fulvus]MBM7588416.1 spore coat protein CotF [Brevibacillus fulvus]